MTIEILEFLQSFRNGFFDFFFNMISFIGEDTIYMIVLATVFFTMDKKKGELLAFVLLFAGVFNNTLKVIVNRNRPFITYPDRITNLRPGTSTGQSFPSGHTQAFASFWFTFSQLYKKKWIWVTTIIFVLLMGLSRMYLGVHYLGDVLTSMVLGFITAWFFNKYLLNMDNDKKTRVYIIICLVFLPLLIIFQSEDLFKTYGMFVGFTLAMFFERKYINFTLHKNLVKNILRVVFGLVLMLVLQLGLKVVFESLTTEGTIVSFIFDGVRYFLISFIGLGLYPLLFKKLNY